MRTFASLNVITRYFALGVGFAFVFVLAGIAGFLPFFTVHPPADAPHLLVDTSYGLLLGLFQVNIIHNLFHFRMGVLGVLAFRSYSSALQFSRFIGITLGVLAVMGLIPTLQTGFGLWPLYGHDIWLPAAFCPSSARSGRIRTFLQSARWISILPVHGHSLLSSFSQGYWGLHWPSGPANCRNKLFCKKNKTLLRNKGGSY